MSIHDKPCKTCGKTDRYISGVCKPCQKQRMSDRYSRLTAAAHIRTTIARGLTYPEYNAVQGYVATKGMTIAELFGQLCREAGII